MTGSVCRCMPSGWSRVDLSLMAFVNGREQALPVACYEAVAERYTSSAEVRAPSLCRRSLRLLCGDWAPHDDGWVGGQSRSGRGHQRSALVQNKFEDSLYRARRPGRCRQRVCVGSGSAGGGQSSPDRPHEAQELARDRRSCNNRAFPARDQALICFVQAQLGLPGDINDRLRHFGPMLFHPLPNFWRCSVIPCCFAENAARGRISGLGDPARPDAAATRMFPGGKPEIGDELTRMDEAGEIADFGDNRRGDNRPDPLQSLEGTNEP